MTDKELLELAAKALGFAALEWNEVGTCPLYPFGNNLYWNPMYENDDAFVLASKLGLTVEFGNNMVLSPVEIGGEGTDPLWATRDAIVRAAAEIGRSKV